VVSTPAERLLAAADLLDKRAGEATAGPWTAEAATSISVLPGGLACEFTTWLVTSPVPDEEGQRTAVVAAERHPLTGSLTGGCFDEDDAAYIATMHPEVGKALAKALRREGNYVRQGEGRAFGGGDLTLPEVDMLALADLLLAGAS